MSAEQERSGKSQRKYRSEQYRIHTAPVFDRSGQVCLRLSSNPERLLNSRLLLLAQGPFHFPRVLLPLEQTFPRFLSNQVRSVSLFSPIRLSVRSMAIRLSAYWIPAVSTLWHE